MPLRGTHGRLAGSGRTLWLKERIAVLREDILLENPVTIMAFYWQNGTRMDGGTHTVRIARISRAKIESNNETSDSHISADVLGYPSLQMEADWEFTSPAYPGLLFRVIKEVIDYNGGRMRRYEIEGVR
jgi:hypothetical protein